MDLLVQRFSAELKRFKREPAYAELSVRYGAIPVISTTSSYPVQR
jgi:polar amino acid transport system substrate-binding protein